MTRNGKIARLPKGTREELNRRLDDGETGVQLVAWLNDRTDTRAMLAEKFGGRAITEQNMSEWKNGGYLEWVARQETMAETEALDEEAVELREATKGRLCDQMAMILASRYAKILVNWRGEVTEELTRQLRTLHGMSREIGQLRRSEHQQMRLERIERLEEKEREKSNEEVVAHFKRWASSPEVHKLICDSCSHPKDRDHGLDVLFGLTTEKVESEESGKVETGGEAEGGSRGNSKSEDQNSNGAEEVQPEEGNPAVGTVEKAGPPSQMLRRTGETGKTQVNPTESHQSDFNHGDAEGALGEMKNEE